MKMKVRILGLFFIIMAGAYQLSMAHDMEMGSDMPLHHGHHHTMDVHKVVNNVNVDLPDVKQQKLDGSKVTFSEALSGARPTILSFIYTSCQDICPVTSQTLSQVQEKALKAWGPLHIVSVSIDPETDTVARLSKYADRYHVGKNWDYLTGTLEASVIIQKAFNAFQGDKMNHAPVYFIHNGVDKKWIRVDGLVSADELIATINETQQLH